MVYSRRAIEEVVEKCGVEAIIEGSLDPYVIQQSLAAMDDIHTIQYVVQ